MSPLLLISNLLLWLAVLGLGIVVLALLRQIGVLHERISPAGALVGREGPRVGERAPVLELRDWQGRVQRIGGEDEHGRATLLLFVSPTCPVCKALIPVARSLRREQGDALRLVFASDGSVEEHEDFVRSFELDRNTYVLSAALGMAYQVGKLPFAVLLDAEGLVRGQGLVNTREHLESLFEASSRGVASIQEYLRTQGRVA